jgi:hypothetical protein
MFDAPLNRTRLLYDKPLNIHILLVKFDFYIKRRKKNKNKNNKKKKKKENSEKKNHLLSW